MPTARYDNSFTDRTPKYSFIISVIINTIGHKIAPAVRLSPRPSTPNKLMFNGAIRKTFSKENILRPTNSATMVLPMNRPVNMINSMNALFLRKLWIAIFTNNNYNTKPTKYKYVGNAMFNF